MIPFASPMLMGGTGGATAPLLIDDMEPVIATMPQISFAFWNMFPNSYAGPCLNIEKGVNTGTRQDIGFTQGICDFAAIASFCGSTDGYIWRGYDQRGDTSKYINGHFQSNRAKIYDGATGQLVLDSTGMVGWQMGNSSHYNYMEFTGENATNVTMMTRFETSDTSAVTFGADNNNEYLGLFTSGSSATAVCNDTGSTSVGTHFKNGTKLTVTNRGNLYTQLGPPTSALRYAVKNAMNYGGIPSFGIYDTSVTDSISMNAGYFSGYGLFYDAQLSDGDVALIDAYLADQITTLISYISTNGF